MALSTRKKNQIIADWKTGKYPSAYALSKAYKVSDKTVTKLTNGIPQANAHIVEVCVQAEHAINSVKNPIERKAVEIAVKEQSISDQIEGIVFEATLGNVTAIKTELCAEKNKLTMFDRKIGQDTIDKALITVGKANRHAPRVEVNNTNALQNNTQIKRVSIVKRSAINE